MDFSIFTHMRQFFDFGVDQSRNELPQNLNDFLANAQVNDTMIAILASLWRDLSEGWDIEFCDVLNHAYDINTEDKILSLNTHGLSKDQASRSIYFAPQVLLGLIEGARMARHIEWLDQALERYHPESIVKIGRICVADNITQTIGAAWHNRADDSLLWKHLLCGAYSDMAQCFDRVMERALTQNKDYDEAVTEAMSLTFRSWFTEPIRVCACDHDSLGVIDALLDDGVIIGSKHIEQASIVCLTLKLGGETTYLENDLIRDIMTNPFYTAIDDRINQTHLMQIIRETKTIDVSGIPFRDPNLATRFMMID